jgi:hypothetical protein
LETSCNQRRRSSIIEFSIFWPTSFVEAGIREISERFSERGPRRYVRGPS